MTVPPLTTAELQSIRDGASHPKSPLSLEDVFIVQRLVDDPCAARAALRGVVNLYVGLVKSGDAGFWDPETIPEIKAARVMLPPE